MSSHDFLLNWDMHLRCCGDFFWFQHKLHDFGKVGRLSNYRIFGPEIYTVYIYICTIPNDGAFLKNRTPMAVDSHFWETFVFNNQHQPTNGEVNDLGRRFNEVFFHKSKACTDVAVPFEVDSCRMTANKNQSGE